MLGFQGQTRLCFLVAIALQKGLDY